MTMRKQDNDYSAFFFLLVMGILLILVSQCETNHELEEISYELRMLQYK